MLRVKWLRRPPPPGTPPILQPQQQLRATTEQPIFILPQEFYDRITSIETNLRDIDTRVREIKSHGWLWHVGLEVTGAVIIIVLLVGAWGVNIHRLLERFLASP